MNDTTTIEPEGWAVSKKYPRYEVSHCGKVRHIKNKNLLKMRIKNEYYYFQISHRGKQKNIYLHHIVTECHKHTPVFRRGERYVIKHLDENKLNCHKDNLEWGTQASNIQDYHRNRRQQYA